MSTITPRTTVASNDVDVMESRAAAAHYRDRVLLKQCSTYPEAQRIVDYLSDSEFPVERTAIVARNLSFVEQVTGTMNSTKAALRGVASGAFSGFFIGLFLGLLVIAPSAWLVLLAWTTGLGAALGALFSMIGYWSMGGERDFQSMGMVTAESYDVYVDNDHIEEANNLLAQL